MSPVLKRVTGPLPLFLRTSSRWTSGAPAAAASPIVLIPNSARKWKDHRIREFSVSSPRRSTNSDFSQHLSPYIQRPYSYAYGRSLRTLQYTTAGHQLTKQATEKPDRLAIISPSEGIRKTYKELNEDVNRLARAMYDKLGVRRGDVIGNWGCNTYRWIVIEYAAARLGAVMTTINPVYKVLELDYALRKANIKVLFMPGDGSIQEEVNGYMGIIHDTRILGGESEDPKNGSGPLPLDHIVTIDGNFEPNRHRIPMSSLDELMAASRADPLPEEIVGAVQSDDPATVMFTSGTTGKPKGALNSHFTMVNNCLLLANSLGMSTKDAEDIRVILPLPFFHSFALTLGTYAMTAMPFTIVIPNFRYDVKKIAEAIISEKCTHVMNTPTMLIDLLNYVEKKGLRLESLQTVMAGGASVPVEVAHRVERLIPSVADVRIGYGSTESGPCCTCSIPGDTPERRMETVGKPLDFVEIKIVNPHSGELIKIGEQGELLTRGHNVMLGYFGDEEKTREAIDEARWYKSGDLATMDEDGYVKIVGRTKEMIIRGGENVYPREIEELLHTHPDVYDAYIVGVPDERYGEEICVWVQLKDKNKKPSLGEEDIRKFCKDRISYFKVPRYVLFVDGFPLTSTGKAQKFIMREESCKILGLREKS